MWDCVKCLCKQIAHDLPMCPQCGQERDMPKITSGGASNAREELEPGAPGAEAAAPVEAAQVPADAEVSPDAEPEAPETGGSDGPPAEAEAEPAPAVPPVESMSKSELQDHADSLGLPTSGTKADLAARIVEHHETAGAVVEEPAPAVEPEV